MANFLIKFRDAHDRSYKTALAEMREGRKKSHWMWYIFPQIKGLGYSETAKFYALEDLDEAKAFLDDQVLGKHLREILSALLEQNIRDPKQIFGYPDYLKFHSSLTLFSLADATPNSIFSEALKQFFGGENDIHTITILQKTN